MKEKYSITTVQWQLPVRNISNMRQALWGGFSIPKSRAEGQTLTIWSSYKA